MLKRVHIRGYKSLRHLDVALGNLCVLFGPNAAGKSNFLDALQLIGRITRCQTLNEAFAPPYRGTPLESFAFPKTGIRGLLEQSSARFTLEIDVELSDAVVMRVERLIGEMKRTKTVREESDAYLDSGKPGNIRERNLRYRVEIEVLPRSGVLRVVDEYLAALSSKGEPKTSRKPFLEKVGSKLHLRMEGQAHPTYHDVHLDHTILSRPLYAPHYPHATALKEELENWYFFYFEPRERMRMANPVREVRHIGLMGENLAAFLNTVRSEDPRQIKGIEKALHAIIPSVTGIDVHVSDLGEVELRILEGDALVPARVVSEGTLRVLGLLCLGTTKDPFSLVGMEEPENGVHPRRIALIAELLRTRAETGNEQLIVTTHSPILPGMIPDKHLFVCRKKNAETTIEPFSTWGDIARRSSIDDALQELPEARTSSISERIMRGDFDA